MGLRRVLGGIGAMGFWRFGVLGLRGLECFRVLSFRSGSLGM